MRVQAMEGHAPHVTDRRGGKYLAGCECRAYLLQVDSKTEAGDIHQAHLVAVGHHAGLVAA